MHVVCLGDVLVDVVAELPGPLAPGSDTPAVVRMCGGGAAANVAAWLVVAGVDATLVGRIGDDVLGRWVTDELTALGVDVQVSVDVNLPTGTCIVLVDPDGERTMVPSSGANDSIGACQAELPEQADLLYVSGYSLLNPAVRPYAVEALRVARERGWPIAVDAASAAPLARMPEFLDLVGRDVLLLANTDEALVLTEFDEAGAAAQSLALRCGQAVVKRGAAGAVWSDGSGVWAGAALDVEVLDTTGAGDAFAAGFVAARLAGAAAGAALKAGAELAARAITHPGARPVVQ